MLTDHPFVVAMQAFDLHRSMGIDWREAQRGRSLLRFRIEGRMITPTGMLHAGYVYTACDMASAAALMSELPHDQVGVTHDMHVSLMRSAGEGEMMDVRAEVVKRGRLVAFLEARCLSGDRLLATARVTKSIVAFGSSGVA